MHVSVGCSVEIAYRKFVRVCGPLARIKDALNLFGPHAKDMQHLTTSLTKREALQTIKVTNLRISSSTKVFFRKVHKRRKLSEEKLCSNLRRVQTYKG
jgi:hypothetical protein